MQSTIVVPAQIPPIVIAEPIEDYANARGKKWLLTNSGRIYCFDDESFEFRGQLD